MKIQADSKIPVLCQLSSHTITISHWRYIGCQKSKDIIHHICLLIIRTPNEMNIPSSPIPRSLTYQRWFYKSLFVCSKIVQDQKSQMERKISTPVCPKFHFIPHPNLKLDIFARHFPAHPDTSPQTTKGLYETKHA